MRGALQVARQIFNLDQCLLTEEGVGGRVVGVYKVGFDIEAQ